MKKVICIKPEGLGPDGPRLVFGVIYEILNEKTRKEGSFYTFVEYGDDILFRTYRFIPLSDIDEKEFHTLRQMERFTSYAYK